jgi:O-antigen ligase
LNKTLSDRSLLWSGVALASFLPVLLAGSRTAVMGLAAGVLILLSVRFAMARIAWILLAGLLALRLLGTAGEGHESLSSERSALHELTATLRDKGVNNTREELWQARWEEFWSSPLTGIGIGMANGAGSAESEASSVVEPGSSYLALLAMTGLLGAGAMAFLLFQLFHQVRVSCQIIPWSSFAERLAILAFLAVHGIAEGWILAAGSPLAFVFWLNLGGLADKARRPFSAAR